MTTTIDWVLAVAGLPVMAAALYLLGLTALWRRPTDTRGLPARLRFRVLVPAHNERAGISATVRSLHAVDYPEAQRRIVVLADNCTDDTAGLAAAAGADVIVRTDPDHRGKGQALEYGIATLLRQHEAGDEWDALVVVDADTIVEGGILRALASRLEGGASAVQAAYLSRPSGTSAVSVITRVAFVAFHMIRSVARERLGLSCGLRGNGMAFRRELLRDVPHAAFSKTEDLEFGIQLALKGIRVAFAGETRVFGDMPEQASAVASQRDRWIGGRVAMARRYLTALVGQAVRRRSLMLADLAIDLMVPPLSLLTVCAVLGVGASFAIGMVSGSFPVSGLVWLVTAAALGVHVAVASRIAGQGRALLRAAGAIPGYALDKTVRALRATRRSDETWVRTPRKGEVL